MVEVDYEESSSQKVTILRVLRGTVTHTDSVGPVKVNFR